MLHLQAVVSKLSEGELHEPTTYLFVTSVVFWTAHIAVPCHPVMRSFKIWRHYSLSSYPVLTCWNDIKVEYHLWTFILWCRRIPSENASQLKALHSLGADIIGVKWLDSLDKERTHHLMMQPGFFFVIILLMLGYWALVVYWNPCWVSDVFPSANCSQVECYHAIHGLYPERQ